MSCAVISQPMLFPWPGFFEQLMLADTYIYLDDVQFSKGSFVNRIQLTYRNERRWMTIPLEDGGSFRKMSDLASAGVAWRASHRSLLQQSLMDAPYRDDALSILDAVYTRSSLLELLIASIEEPARYMGIGQKRSIYRSSQLSSNDRSWKRVLELVQEVGADRYITGHGAANYLDHSAFDNASIKVEYMNYSCTPWPQPGPSFTPYVTILDLIARVGPDARSYLFPATTPWREFMQHRELVQ